jgi:hypothetical protein
VRLPGRKWIGCFECRRAAIPEKRCQSDRTESNTAVPKKPSSRDLFAELTLEMEEFVHDIIPW